MSTDPNTRAETTAGATPASAVTADRHVDRHVDRKDVVALEKSRVGGVKIGSAFFGWLTATGMSVLLIALVAAAGTAVGLSNDVDLTEAADQAAQDPQAVGLVGGIALLVILFIAYYSGGYVAGRMSRFHGARQGIAVWGWAVVIAVVIAIVAAVAGDQYDVLNQLNVFPRLPVNEGDLTTTALIVAGIVALTALVGAVLGGLAGMRFHRKADKAGLGA